ncbi:MAG: hypothetical protein A2W28_06605 [Gammaproteobacteria bacterium RBG_16_51_14]|nr:MAG: hypothetical protein A2W28_06605 [Gammaproteobacteria bacterium RBG_16_51_14]
MKLAELAFACYVYSQMSDYDSSYCQLLKATRPQMDFRREDHCMALLRWLNAWGCRQFAVQYHQLAAREIEMWYEEIADRFFPFEKSLMSLSEDDFKIIQKAYSELSSRTASKRKSRNGNMTRVKIGPTGAAKILFALRPNSLIPWDEPIRAELDIDGGGHSYCEYLRKVRNHLKELSDDCERSGFALIDLPQKLNRRESSVAKLIDEYYWVTVTRGCSAPKEDDLRRWVSWF